MLNRVSVYAICLGLLTVNSGLSSDSNNNNNSIFFAPLVSLPADDLSVISTDQRVQSYLEKIQKHLVPSHREDPSEWVRLLSLDGGGLRGLIFLPQLWALEILTGKRIHELFDIIGGTSTGGISAIGMSYMDASGQVMPLKDLIKVYLNCSREIFPAATAYTETLGLVTYSYKYSAAGLERVIKTMVGEDKFGSDKFKTPVLITAVDENNDALKIFCSEDESDNHNIWKIARATSAAKIYLPFIEINDTVYADGGHKENHPAKVFWKYYQHNLSGVFKGSHQLDNNKLSIYSFGTGNIQSYCESSVIKSRGMRGLILSTIQNQFSRQENEANTDLMEQVGLYRAVIDNEEQLVDSLPIYAERRKDIPRNTAVLKQINQQLQDIQLKLETLAKQFEFFQAQKTDNMASREMIEEHLKLSNASLDDLNEKKKELEEKKKRVLEAMKGPMDSIKDRFIVQAFHRSQTESLPVELHEMDDVRKASGMFEKGMEMLFSSSFKNLLKSLFRPELNVCDEKLDEALKYISQKIRTELDLLDISDTKALTMLSIIDDCHTKFETMAMPDTYFTDLLYQAGYNLDNLDMSHTETLLKWTHALYNENNHHWGHTGSKAHSLGDNLFAGLAARVGVTDPTKWESIHSSIHRQISNINNKLLSHIVSYIKALDESSYVEKFGHENIDAQINLAIPTATWLAGMPNGSDQDKLFDEHIVAPLRLREIINGSQDNLPHQLILREIRFRLEMGKTSTQGYLYNSSSAGHQALINRIDSYLTMMN